MSRVEKLPLCRGAFAITPTAISAEWIFILRFFAAIPSGGSKAREIQGDSSLRKAIQGGASQFQTFFLWRRTSKNRFGFNFRNKAMGERPSPAKSKTFRFYFVRLRAWLDSHYASAKMAPLTFRVIAVRAVMIFGLVTFTGCATPQWIRPGAVWLDHRGQPIQAHGGGITQLGKTYYWFGEDRSRDNDPNDRYLACYSSTDLAHWTFRRQVVKLSDPDQLGSDWVLERPKVFYNAKTKRFVLYAHIDGRGGYKFASVAVFTCDTVDGDYRYLKSFRPLDHESRDIGQFIDDDGSAYLIFEDRPYGFRIAKLSDDYLTVNKEMCLIPEHLEGGALVHYQGLYYVIGSELTGWQANPNKYATAKSLQGPWSEFKDIAPPPCNTYGSQSSMMLKVAGTKTTTVIFMGDIWKPTAQWDSRYVWMPLEIGGGKLWLPQPENWMFNVKTGEATMVK